jgi:hypothetical protein
MLKSVKSHKYRLILTTPFSTRSTISYGLIVYAKDTKRWALVRRKHSVEFLLFIRGLYRITHLPLLLSAITPTEANIIRTLLYGDPKLFTNFYLNDLDLEASGLSYAITRMADSRIIVLNLLSKLDINNNKLKWTWPKGRLIYNSISTDERETPFSCAKREFTEEVEIELPPPIFVSDTYITENIFTVTGRNIESRYWIYVIPNEIPINPPYNHPEVSDRQWIDSELCSQLIHHDELFKEINNIVTSLCD